MNIDDMAWVHYDSNFDKVVFFSASGERYEADDIQEYAGSDMTPLEIVDDCVTGRDILEAFWIVYRSDCSNCDSRFVVSLAPAVWAKYSRESGLECIGIYASYDDAVAQYSAANHDLDMDRIRHS